MTRLSILTHAGAVASLDTKPAPSSTHKQRASSPVEPGRAPFKHMKTYTDNNSNEHIGRGDLSSPSPENSHEEWRAIPSFPMYEASSQGRIRRIGRYVNIRGTRLYVNRIRLLRLAIDNRGYLRVSVYRDGHCRSKDVHVLVAEAFHGLRPQGLMVCHFNGIKTDNRPSNLRYDTAKANAQDAIRHGVVFGGSKSGGWMPVGYYAGERNPNSKLTPQDVTAIRGMLGAVPRRDICKQFGIGRNAVSDIALRKKWAHLPVKEPANV